MTLRIFSAIDTFLYNGKALADMARLSDGELVRLIDEIVVGDPPFELLHSFTSKPPFNNLTRYHRKLIDQFKNQILHDILRMLTSKLLHGSRIEKLFEDIMEELYTRLQRTKEIIHSLDQNISREKDHEPLDRPVTMVDTERYIYDYLRSTLIQILSEMHTHFRDIASRRQNLGVDSLTGLVGIYKPQETNDVQPAIESAAMPGMGTVAESGVPSNGASGHDKAKPGDTCTEADSPAFFVAIRDDVRPPRKGIVKYLDMIRDPRHFGWIEEHFVRVGFIDANYRFCDRHGHKKLFAGIYHLMIEMNCFKAVDDSTGKRIRPVDVRRFLDYRYGVSLEKQFQPSSLGAEERAELLRSFDWLH